jgi:murein DD-endopeptidase MepM/ murein hydrolase activator NlpD
MRRTLLTLVVFLALAPAAAAQGGAQAPETTVESGDTGGVRPGDRTAKRVIKRQRRLRRLRARPVLASFELADSKLFVEGRPARVSYRVDARARSVKVRLYMVPAAGGKAVQTLELGEQSTGASHRASFAAGELAPGRYRLRIAARDRRGRALRSAASVASVRELAVYGHRFPLVGDFSYGGEDSRFGAPRKGHTHQGQDLSAAEGTPVVAPAGGTVETVEFQRNGAGHYVVVGGYDGRDYVFMHLRTGSIVVEKGGRVLTGQRLADVGNTGSSSGAHLHFEIWEGAGGWFDGGQPIDPLPLLKSWDRYS